MTRCSWCPGNHRTKSHKCNVNGCNHPQGTPCSHTTLRRPNFKGPHSAVSKDCPIKKKAMEEAKKAREENPLDREVEEWEEHEQNTRMEESEFLGIPTPTVPTAPHRPPPFPRPPPPTAPPPPAPTAPPPPPPPPPPLSKDQSQDLVGSIHASREGKGKEEDKKNEPEKTKTGKTEKKEPKRDKKNKTRASTNAGPANEQARVITAAAFERNQKLEEEKIIAGSMIDMSAGATPPPPNNFKGPTAQLQEGWSLFHHPHATGRRT